MAKMARIVKTMVVFILKWHQSARIQKWKWHILNCDDILQEKPIATIRVIETCPISGEDTEECLKEYDVNLFVLAVASDYKSGPAVTSDYKPGPAVASDYKPGPAVASDYKSGPATQSCIPLAKPKLWRKEIGWIGLWKRVGTRIVH